MREEMESLWGAMKASHYRRTIDQLTRSIRDTQSLEDALKAALEMVMRAAHAETGTFWFYDRFKDGRICAKAVGGGADLSAIRLLPGEGIAGQVIQSGKSVIIQDCQADPRWAEQADRRTGFVTRTMLCIPLRYQQDTFGCIQIINRTDAGLFDGTDLEFAERLAAHTSYLFAAHHMLDDYTSGIMLPQPDGNEPSFTQLFSAGAFAEAEAVLRKLPMVAALPEEERTDLLNRSREIWDILDRNRASGLRKRAFHLFEKN